MKPKKQKETQNPAPERRPMGRSSRFRNEAEREAHRKQIRQRIFSRRTGKPASYSHILSG